MSVHLTLANDLQIHYLDDDEGLRSYAVTDAGVLRVMTQSVHDWTVIAEYSPAGWLDVNGLRYVGSRLDGKPGIEGATKELPPESKPMVVLR
jgi:hypothetical protein